MPYYEVTHSLPLTIQQKTRLAEKITHLHSRAFTTPSMFVNVNFQAVDATTNNYFIGGKVKNDYLNRIAGYVRTSDQRKKEHFDKLAADIENAWMVAIGEKADDEDEEQDSKNKDEDKSKKHETEAQKMAKRLVFVVFFPMITVREKGLVVPSAGGEGAWIKENRKDFEERAEMGDEDIKGMLEEIETRDDLKAWREGVEGGKFSKAATGDKEEKGEKGNRDEAQEKGDKDAKAGEGVEDKDSSGKLPSR